MIDNLFLHYPITLGLWHRIFTQVGMKWVPLDNICDMVVISMRIACFSLLWIVWRERNARIF